MVKNIIKQRRVMLDMTQYELSKLVGVSRQTINSIENGKVIPNIELAILISNQLLCQVDDLFHLEREFKDKL